jgi:HD-like signal output (HDOD) protein
VVLGTFVEVSAESIRELAHERKMSFEKAEHRILGIDHAEVGAFLLEGWKLPEHLVQAVRWHHQPEYHPGDPLVANVVHIADVVCLMAGVGAGLDALSYRPSIQVMGQLGLETEVLAKTGYEILNDLMEIRKIFKLD